MFFEFFHILVHVFEIIVEAHALCFQFHGQFFDHLVDLVVDHDLRDIDFGIVDSRLQDFRVEFFQSLEGCFRFEAFADVGFEVVDAVEFAGFFSEFIVDGREFAAFYVVDFNGEDSFFASQGFFEVIFREGDFDVFFVASFAADELIFKARDEAAGADLERIGFAFAAFECDAVDSAFEIDDSEVIFCDFRAFRSYDEFRMLFLEISQFFGYVFVGYVDFVFGNGNALVFAEFDFRFLGDRSFKYDVFAFFVSNDVQFRFSYRNDAFLVEGVAVGFIGNSFKNFLFDSIFAQEAFQYHARCFPLAEARDIDTACQVLASCCCLFGSVFSGHFNVQGYFVLVYFIHCYVHSKYVLLMGR